MALTLTTEAEIIRRAGLGANSTITLSSALLISIGERAEKELISDTKREWITNFADINASVKGKISKAVASLSAKEIVLYDRSGYFNTLEQQTILDVLTDDYINAVKNLSALDANQIKTVNA